MILVPKIVLRRFWHFYWRTYSNRKKAHSLPHHQPKMSLKSSLIFLMMTTKPLRIQVIQKKHNKTLTSFQISFKIKLKNIRSKMVRQISSPLNQPTKKQQSPNSHIHWLQCYQTSLLQRLPQQSKPRKDQQMDMKEQSNRQEKAFKFNRQHVYQKQKYKLAVFMTDNEVK